MSSSGIEARRVAAAALRRVEQEGAFLNLAVRSLLDRGGLGPAEAALALALSAGVLRWKSRIDFALSRVSRRPVPRIDPLLLQILRLAAYEVAFGRETPAPVAVDLAVGLARRLLGRGEAAFANGVLRALVRLAEAQGGLPSPERGPVHQRLATAFGHPEWLVRRWFDRFGEATTAAILEANNAPMPLSVRVQCLRTSLPRLGRLWDSCGIAWRASRLLPEAALVERPGAAVEDLPGFREGLFTPQSEAAMLPARAVAPRPGETAVDLCAAPGGKTTHLAELSGDAARIAAVDLHEARLRLVRDNAARLGLGCIRIIRADGRRPPLASARPDAVLVDAPCTALGTIGRRPDVRWRRRPDDVTAMAAVQAELLEAAAGLLRPGGRLVYSVCSFEPEETVEVVRRVCATRRLMAVPLRPHLGTAGQTLGLAEDEAWLTLLPHRVRTDGFFVVRLEPRRA